VRETRELNSAEALALTLVAIAGLNRCRIKEHKPVVRLSSGK